MASAASIDECHGKSRLEKHCLSESASSCDWKQLRGVEGKVDAGLYYSNYAGHTIEHLVRVREGLERDGCHRFTYLVGDSSLDNKHWFFKTGRSKEAQITDKSFTAPCVNGYECVLEPPRMVKDVSYWMNLAAEERLKGQERMCTLMTSVEESTLSDRNESLLIQDAFVRDHITADDYLVVSVGGNDVALRPTAWTIFYMFLLTRSPDWMIRNRIAPGFGYFVELFGAKIEHLVDRIVAKQRPSKILLCMIYYLDEVSGGSWADDVLSKLGYDANPAKLQLIIRSLFEAIRERAGAAGHHKGGVHHFPLFAVLDGKDTRDYCQRVEPSVEGGRKMADALMEVLLADDSEAAIDALLLSKQPRL